MKSKVVAISLTVLSLCILAGAFFDNHDQRNIGEKVVSEISENNITYIEEVTDPSSGYFGAYLYSDGEYEYYVDVETRRIMSVSIIKGLNLAVLSTEVITSDEAVVIAEKCFKSIMGDSIVGNLESSVRKMSETKYDIIVVERIEGMETGTKGFFSVEDDGTISAASFVEGIPDAITNLDKSQTISEQEAVNIAYSSVEKDGEDIIKSDIKAELKAHGDITFWSVTIPTKAEFNGNPFVRNYYFSIDAYSKEIIEKLKDVA